MTRILSELSQQSVINVKDYGAVGDGVTDDTNAIILALEIANSLTIGTWRTGYDSYSGPVTTRTIRPVFLPVGKYRVTSTIPIRYRGVTILGDDNRWRAGPYPHIQTQIIFDPSGADTSLFNLDRTYACSDFNISNVELLSNAVYGTIRYAIYINGSNYTFGPYLNRVKINNFYNGIYQTSGADGAELKLTNCAINGCDNLAIFVDGHITNGEIIGCSLTSNGPGVKDGSDPYLSASGGRYTGGGIRLGGKNFIIEDNDFEGQNRPLEIVASNSQRVTIRNNYFEQNGNLVGSPLGTPDPSTYSLIHLGAGSDFVVENNHVSVYCPIPYLTIDGAQRAYSDWPIAALTVVGADVRNNDIIVPDKGYYDLDGSDKSPPTNEKRVFGTVYVKGKHRGWDSDYTPSGLYKPTLSSLAETLNIDGKIYACEPIDVANYPQGRILPYGAITWPSGQVMNLVFGIKYTNTIPVASGNKNIGAIVDIGTGNMASSTFMLQNSFETNDIVFFRYSSRNNTGAPVTFRPYIYPYGTSTSDTGNGAKLFAINAWTETSTDSLAFGSGRLRHVNPLRIGLAQDDSARTCVISKAFTYSNMGTTVATTSVVPANAKILRSTVIVTTPFSGGSSPTCTVFVDGTVDTTLQLTTDNNLEIANQYEITEIITVANTGLLKLTLAGTASAGSGLVLVEYVVTPQV